MALSAARRSAASACSSTIATSASISNRSNRFVTAALDQRFVPLAHAPTGDDAVHDERIAGRERFGGFAGGEDRHRAVARIGKRADHQQFSALHERLPASAM